MRGGGFASPGAQEEHIPHEQPLTYFVMLGTTLSPLYSQGKCPALLTVSNSFFGYAVNVLLFIFII